MYLLKTLAILLVATPILSLAPGERVWSQNPTVASTPDDTSDPADEISKLQDDVAKLQNEKDDLWSQMTALGNGEKPMDAKLALEYQIRDMLLQQRRLSEILDDAEEARIELERLREEATRAARNHGQSLADVAFREAIKKLFKKIFGDATPAGRAVGVAEQIARYLTHRSNRAAIVDLIESGRLTRQDLYLLWYVLREDLELARGKLQTLEELLEEYRSVSGQLLRAKDRLEHLQLVNARATGHAVMERETDAAGDREEAIRGAVTPSIRKVPPRQENKATSSSRSVKPKPKKQSSQKTESLQKTQSSQARQHETGTSAAAIQFGVGVGLQLLNRGSRSGSQQNQGSNWNR